MTIYAPLLVYDILLRTFNCIIRNINHVWFKILTQVNLESQSYEATKLIFHQHKLSAEHRRAYR